MRLAMTQMMLNFQIFDLDDIEEIEKVRSRIPSMYRCTKEKEEKDDECPGTYRVGPKKTCIYHCEISGWEGAAPIKIGVRVPESNPPCPDYL